MSDRTFGALDTLVAGWARASSRSRIRRVKAVGRELSLQVERVEQAADGVIAITLGPRDGSELPGWHPGAHVDLVLPSGKVRQYSLCSNPGDRTTYRIAVRRIADGGGGSVEAHHLGAGTSVRVRGPRNAFPFAYPHLAKQDIDGLEFIAGGIGITALLPMIRAASDAQIRWRLTYVGRSRESMPFLDEIAGFRGGDVRILHGAPTPEEVLVGVGTTTSVYFCGPPPFLATMKAALAEHPHAGFHFERFSPPPVVGGRPFTVHLAVSELDVEVPEDRSALAAIREVLPDVPYSCQQGYCGTCRVGVVEGTQQRRGTADFMAGDDDMLICVDRAETPHIALDL